MQDERTLQKIARLDDHISVAYVGLSADARVMTNKARLECQSYRLRLEDAPTVEFVARHIGQMQQKYTQRGGVRPFGLAILIAGVGADGVPQLWSSDPSGVYSSWKANAQGRSSKSLQELLEKQYDKTDGSEEEALKLAVRALLEVVESGAKSIEVGILRRGQAMEMAAEARISALVQALEKEKAEGAEGGGGGGQLAFPL
jgi:20S proteasome subunit alpha 4